MWGDKKQGVCDGLSLQFRSSIHKYGFSCSINESVYSRVSDLGESVQIFRIVTEDFAVKCFSAAFRFLFRFHFACLYLGTSRKKYLGKILFHGEIFKKSRNTKLFSIQKSFETVSCIAPNIVSNSKTLDVPRLKRSFRRFAEVQTLNNDGFQGSYQLTPDADMEFAPGETYSNYHTSIPVL